MTRPPDEGPDFDRDERGGVDVEAAWAQIVAHWEEVAPGHPEPRDGARADDGGDHLVLDVTDARQGSDTLAEPGPTAAEQGDRADTAEPADQELHDYPTRPTRHRLTPEEVAELADERWAGDAGDRRGGADGADPSARAGRRDGPADDRRPDRDWRRSWSSPASHVGGEEARSGRSRSLDDDEAEGFEPPEPPPLPRGDLISTFAWAGALGAPLFLLIAALFWRSAPSLLIGAAITAFVAGFVTLVVRMPDRSEDEDDGAVV